MLRIVVEREGEIIADQSVSDTLITIGRAPDNQIVLADEQMSSHHLVIKRGGDGVFTAIDQSVNGTFRDGSRFSTLRITAPVVVVAAGYEITMIPAAATDTVESNVPGNQDVTETEDLTPLRQKVAPRSDSRPAAKLSIEWDDGRVDSITFVDSAIVGRDEDCDLIIDSREVSRKHAFFFRRGQDYLVKRLSKVNPVLINSRVIGEGDSARLHDGDVVDMSGFHLRFHRPDSAVGDRPTLVEGRQPNIGFSIEVRWETREIVRVELLGFLGEKTTPRFEAEIPEWLHEARRATIDLGYLIGIDENGLGSLVRLAAECDRRGIRLTLTNLPPRVLDALNGSSVRKVLEPYIDRSSEARPVGRGPS